MVPNGSTPIGPGRREPPRARTEANWSRPAPGEGSADFERHLSHSGPRCPSFSHGDEPGAIVASSAALRDLRCRARWGRVAGPLAQGGGVTYGSTWVGPLGLLDLLEKRLGLGGRFDNPSNGLADWSRSCPVSKDTGASPSRSIPWRPAADSCTSAMSCGALDGPGSRSPSGSLNWNPPQPTRRRASRIGSRRFPSHPAGIENLVSYTPVAHFAPV